ncbi:MAG: alpha/beta hydrolase [Anaerolineae bacterium]
MQQACVLPLVALRAGVESVPEGAKDPHEASKTQAARATQMRIKVIAVTLVVLLLLLVVGPLLVPVPPLADTLPPEKLADEDSLFMQVNGLTVHVKIAGEGQPTLILLHGFGASLFSWHQVMPELAAYGTVVAYDRPASGLTERPMTWEGENPYSPEAQVKLAIGLMDALNVDKAILVGHSAGGKIAFETALAHPERVQALIGVGPAVYAGGGAPAWARPLLGTPQVRHLGPLIARQLGKSGDAFLRSAWHDPSKITAETYAGYRRPLQVENWDRALWELTAASTESDLAERVPEISLPVLVITGDDDRIVPTEQSVRLADSLPDAQLSVLPACGHLPHEECPGEFMQAVGDFLLDWRQ